MDTNSIVSLITSVGFPIVMCGVMCWYVKYITDHHREDMAKEREQHDIEMKEVTQAITNNTLAITKLTDLISDK